MVKASEIAAAIGHSLVGTDVYVERVSLPHEAKPGSLVWAKKYSPKLLEVLNGSPGIFAIVPKSFAGRLTVSHVVVAYPKYEFAQAVSRFFAPKSSASIHPSAVVSPTAKLGEDVSIGPFCVIDDGVTIGDRCRIASHVVIRNASLGSGCTVKSHAVIGEDGFGFAFDELNRPFRMPHLGRVVIGEDVEIGSSTSVMRGTIGDTTIGDFTKIDDQVLIAHNVQIGKSCVLAGCSTLAGSVIVDDNAWIAPQAVILNGGTRIGSHAVVGLGAVVVKHVEPYEVVFGEAATVLRNRSEGERF